MAATIFSNSATEVKTLKSILSINDVNKIISGSSDPTLVATTANPGSLYLNDTNAKVYRKLDSGSSTNWVEIGSGTSGKNYIASSDGSSTTGWATYADAAGTRPVNGTGGSATVTWTSTSSSPLSGLASFLFTKDAANRQGEGVSYDFTIDAADKAKMLGISFDYAIASGTFVGSGVNTTNSDLIVYIYDVTNSALIEPSLIVLDGGPTSGSFKFKSLFQTSSSSVSYRLIIHVATTSTSAYTVKFDNVVVGPEATSVSGNTNAAKMVRTTQQTISSASATKVAFDSVSSANNGFDKGGLFNAGNNRLIAQSSGLYLVEGSILTGGVASSNSYTISIYKNGSSALAKTIDTAATANTNTQVHGVLDLVAGDYLELYTTCSDSAYTLEATGNATYLTAVKLSDAQSSGASQNVALNVAATAATSTANNTETTVLFDTVTSDTSGSYVPATGIWTAPSSGYYSVEAQLNYDSNATGLRYVYVYKNNSTAMITAYYDTSTATNKTVAASRTFYLAAGDNLRVKARQTSGGSLNVGGNVDLNWFSISKVAAPSATTASPVVAARYSSVAGTQTIANGATTIINFEVISFDLMASVTIGSSWKFTAPVAGIYSMSTMVRTDKTTLSDFLLELFKNGSQVSRSGSSVVGKCTLTDMIQLNAGDYIDIRLTNNAGSTATLVADATQTFISIAQVK